MIVLFHGKPLLGFRVDRFLTVINQNPSASFFFLSSVFQVNFRRRKVSLFGTSVTDFRDIRVQFPGSLQLAVASTSPVLKDCIQALVAFT